MKKNILLVILTFVCIQVFASEIPGSLEKNKIMVTSENLFLREKSSTSSKKLALLKKDAVVKILEVGEEAIIDGIKSKWVKVQAFTNIYDLNNHSIAKELIGWFYGGYLTDTTKIERFLYEGELFSISQHTDPSQFSDDYRIKTPASLYLVNKNGIESKICNEDNSYPESIKIVKNELLDPQKEFIYMDINHDGIDEMIFSINRENRIIITEIKNKNYYVIDSFMTDDEFAEDMPMDSIKFEILNQENPTTIINTRKSYSYGCDMVKEYFIYNDKENKFELIKTELFIKDDNTNEERKLTEEEIEILHSMK